ncbi:MAG TPA: hypothetical protein VFS43_23415 [Polyangiaceae bacterium]|nr:hypothetical protein [Polyangiaceae bacterium]
MGDLEPPRQGRAAARPLEGEPNSTDDVASAHKQGIELLRWLGRRKVGHEGAGASGTYE